MEERGSLSIPLFSSGLRFLGVFSPSAAAPQPRLCCDPLHTTMGRVHGRLKQAILVGVGDEQYPFRILLSSIGDEAAGGPDVERDGNSVLRWLAGPEGSALPWLTGTVPLPTNDRPTRQPERDGNSVLRCLAGPEGSALPWLMGTVPLPTIGPLAGS